MKTWHNPTNILREEFDDGNGGSGDDYSPDVESVDQSDGSETPSPAAPPAFDYDRFAETLGRHIPQQSQPAPQMSEAEFNKQMKRWDPNNEVVEAMFGANATPESRMAAMQQMVNGMYTHQNTVVGTYLQHALSQMEAKLRAEYEPVKQTLATQQAEKFKSGFLSKHKWAAPMNRLFEPAVQSLQSRGVRPRDEAHAHELIAAEIESFAKQANPQFVRPVAGNQRNSLPSMAGMSNGHGGGSGGPQRRDKKKDYLDIFEPARR